MKIALFAKYPRKDGKLKGGVAAVAVGLVKALSKLADVELHVITFDRSLQNVAVETHVGVTIHRLPGSGWPQILDIQFGPGRKRLIDYVMKLAPDILHTHENYGLALGDFPIPHVFTLHGFDSENIMAGDSGNTIICGEELKWLHSKLWAVVERRLLYRLRFIISITPYVRHKIKSYTQAIIYDIDNPLDPQLFEIERHEEPGRILCVGWISKRKNTLAAVQALAKVRMSGLNAKLSIAGEPLDQTYYHKVIDYIDKEGLSECVQFLGHINHDQLFEELSKASILVLPSRQENAPLAIAEAMAVGIPVISSNRCGMPFMIREGVTGYLTEPEDVDLLARHMISLLNDSNLRNTMGNAGRSEAERHFHPDKVAEKTIEAYRNVIELSLNRLG